MTPEIRLAQAPAHARHGSNIGQPLTRREGVLKVKVESEEGKGTTFHVFLPAKSGE